MELDRRGFCRLVDVLGPAHLVNQFAACMLITVTTATTATRLS